MLKLSSILQPKFHGDRFNNSVINYRIIGVNLNKKLRFGPAGKPLKYKGKSEEVPCFLYELGLNAYEYQAVRGVRISEDKAKTLARLAGEFDVELSMHAPYYINLCSAKESVIESSIQRLVASLRVAELMDASIVVFHPGYYGDFSSEEALSVCVNSLNKVVEYAKSEGISSVYLSPETMGKIKQLGDLNEILILCECVENTIPTIDWAHLHARGRGIIRTKNDYLKILFEIERRLGSEVVKNLHMHFTKVSFSVSGEVKHYPLGSRDYGPDFKYLAELIVEHGYCFTIISESPLLEDDALLMKNMVEKLIKV